MIAKKNILIIGGTGFIGYHLAKQSLQKGWKVTSISSKLPKKIRYLKKVKYLRCDITKKKLLKEKIKKNFDYVVNLGGYVDHTNKKKTFKSHYQGCKNLTEIFSDEFSQNLANYLLKAFELRDRHLSPPNPES